ncbi:S9 family peptidase [Emcibacter sp.]|uniref:S9 family peptidase n=1 Tax=Emcibacter sp. TaxID=1979954 RepID=UPI002AA6438E|nr:S9 family peptidase [Emcibacter sp.]
MKITPILALGLTLALWGCDNSTPQNTASSEQSETVKAPVAKKVPYTMEIHGDVRVDDYYWLRDDDRKDPEVLAYLDAENAYTKSVMAHTEGLQAKLFEEIKGRIKRDDSSVPYKKNGYWYYSNFTGDQEYPVYARRASTMDADEEIILNVNKLAEGKEFFSLGGLAVSTNNNILAYSTDALSRRLYIIEFKNLATGQTYDDRLENTSGVIVWADDNKTVFYIKKDLQTLLGYQVYRHILGTDQKDDVLVYEEKDPTFYTYIGKTRDDSVIYIFHKHTTKTGADIIDADQPESEFTPFLSIEEGHEYEFSKLGDDYYIRTNWNAKNFRLMKVSGKETSDKSKWVDVIPHRPDVYVSDFEVFSEYLVVREKEHGVTRLRVQNIQTGQNSFLKFDDPAYAAYFGYNPEINTDKMRVFYSSLTTPDTVYEYDLTDGRRTILKQEEILGGFDPTNYASERIFIKARDGKEVPVSLVYRKDKFKKDGTNPLYQYAYGSYGDTEEATFDAARLSILDRGFVYALAHIRGSQMLGREWYEDGKLYHKKNSFTDFIDVTKGLTAQGYGDKDKVFAVGLSAGGLLMGAVLNMAPELYKGVAAQVPFVDVVTTMLDSSIPLTTNEYDEWGNPNEKGYYDYMKSYSPYDNVERKDYPNIMVTTGLRDSQVQYFEPAKWVAKLRDYKTDDNLLIFDVNMDAGHGGSSGRYKQYRDKALELAFFFDLIGIKE